MVGHTPETVTTDGHRSYPRAVRETMGHGGMHRTKIDPSHWPEVTRRVEQGESLRQVARAYEVSYETIRRVLVTQQTRRLAVTGQG